MSIRDEILRRIANTLIMYSYHITENGLLHGKSGAMLFLYLYSQHSGDEVCYDYAGELLDGLMKSASDAPPDFEDGAAGLGWCIGRLLRADIVGGRPNGVLGAIDNRVLHAMNRNQWSESWHELIYCADRIADFKAEGNRGYFELILSYIEWQITEQHLKLSDSKKWSLLHYIDKFDDNFGKSMQTDALRQAIAPHPLIGVGQPEDKSFAFRDDNDEKRIRQYISSSVWAIISDKPLTDVEPEISELLNFVERQQFGLTPDDLRLSDGLAGLGTLLLINEFKNT